MEWLREEDRSFVKSMTDSDGTFASLGEASWLERDGSSILSNELLPLAPFMLDSVWVRRSIRLATLAGAFGSMTPVPEPLEEREKSNRSERSFAGFFGDGEAGEFVLETTGNVSERTRGLGDGVAGTSKDSCDRDGVRDK